MAIEKVFGIADALASLLGSNGWSVVDDRVVFSDPSDPNNPTMNTLTEEMVSLQRNYDAFLYKRLRVIAYGKLNQSEMQFDDMMNGTNKWRDAILSIKEQFPKGMLP